MPYRRFGGGEQPYGNLPASSRSWRAPGFTDRASGWACTGVSCPLLNSGTAEQRERWMPGMLRAVTVLGLAYCRAEAAADPMPPRWDKARGPIGSVFWRNGTQGLYLAHAGQAGTSMRSAPGIPATPNSGNGPLASLLSRCRRRRPGVKAGASPEHKMGSAARPRRRCCSGTMGQGCPLVTSWSATKDARSRSALGRAGAGRARIAAVAAEGRGPAALDLAVRYATERRQSGSRSLSSRGCRFMLAGTGGGPTSWRRPGALYWAAAKAQGNAGPAVSDRRRRWPKLFASDYRDEGLTKRGRFRCFGGTGYVGGLPGPSG